MGFGDSVAALLETYLNCLSLLKAFKYHEGKNSLGAEDQKSQLRKSLKADRASIERAYAARLSESGHRLEKGDGKTQPIPQHVMTIHSYAREKKPVPSLPWTTS